MNNILLIGLCLLGLLFVSYLVIRTIASFFEEPPIKQVTFPETLLPFR